MRHKPLSWQSGCIASKCAGCACVQRPWGKPGGGREGCRVNERFSRVNGQEGGWMEGVVGWRGGGWGEAQRQERGDGYSCAERRSDSHKQQQKKGGKRQKRSRASGTHAPEYGGRSHCSTLHASETPRQKVGQEGAVEETKGKSREWRRRSDLWEEEKLQEVGGTDMACFNSVKGCYKDVKRKEKVFLSVVKQRISTCGSASVSITVGVNCFAVAAAEKHPAGNN